MGVHLLGIRHHGPGSARAVKAFLEQKQPDIILVEGPPEGDGLLEWVLHEEMQPPVALLVYNPDKPQQASFYPFAEFSPEWQAITYARRAGIPVKFMDLPAAHSLALEDNDAKQEVVVPTKAVGEPATEPEVEENPEPAVAEKDAISYLAEAAGWNSGEQ